MSDDHHSRVLRRTVWLVLMLASCALPPSSENSVPSSLRRYRDVASFLLPGYPSIAFYTLPLDGVSATSVQVALCARCGSDFQAPDGVGYGPYRGVEVLDFGPSGIGDDKPAGNPITIGGSPAWHLPASDRPGSKPTADSWVAHVDGRFSVASCDRDLLELALQRSGRLDRLLMPFASLPALPPDSESVVYLLPRPTDRTYWGRPVPIEMMRATLSSEQRLRLWHRQPLPEQFTSWSAYAQVPPATTSEDGWQVTTMDLHVDPTMRWLLLDLLSGLAIFI